MEQRHRDLIKNNFKDLVEKTSDENLQTLVSILVRDNIFSETSAKKYLETEHENSNTRTIQFFLDIETRGPSAFNHLVNGLDEIGSHDLARLLCPDINSGIDREMPSTSHSQSLGARMSNLPNYMSEVNAHLQQLVMTHPQAVVNLSTQPVAVNVRKAKQRFDIQQVTPGKIPHYRMSSNPKGLALIINIVNFKNDIHGAREGAEVDGESMLTLMEGLGYKAELLKDLDCAVFKETIRTFAKRQEHACLDSTMVTIMSHGKMMDSPNDLTTVIYAADGIPIKYLWIIEQFNSENCPYLINKPKVFFFQACRGSDESSGVMQVIPKPISNILSTQTDGQGYMPPVRLLSDILIAHATARGYVAMRDRFCGTWFIQTVVEIFMNHACDTHVTEMLQMVDLKMRNRCSEQNTFQTTCIETLGFNYMFINPGIYEDPSPIVTPHTQG